MNSPKKGKKKLSDGTSTEQIVISTTKSFQAKIVTNPVNTNVSKQQNLLSGKKSPKKADRSNVDKHIKLGDEMLEAHIRNYSPSKQVIAFDLEEANEKFIEDGGLRVKQIEILEDSNSGLREQETEKRGSESTYAYTRTAAATGSTGDGLGLKHNFGEQIMEESEEASHINAGSVMRQRAGWSHSGLGEESTN